MGLFQFGKAANPAITLGAAMMALVANETTTAEQVDAANQELDAAGIKGAQLVPSAALETLVEKAGRVDAAETAATTATNNATELQAKLDTANTELATLRKLPGASHTNPALPAGTTDVPEESAADDNQKAIDALPHNVAIDSNPLFAKRIEG